MNNFKKCRDQKIYLKTEGDKADGSQRRQIWIDNQLVRQDEKEGLGLMIMKCNGYGNEQSLKTVLQQVLDIGDQPSLLNTFNNIIKSHLQKDIK